jgi:ATP phosphoribosyltransferase regulatory subunit
MDNFKMYIPEGMRDILYEECSYKNEIINILRNRFRSSGFREICSPTLEYYDVFYEENISIEQEKTYKLFDSKGRILVLKPDATVPIARIAATKLKESAYPLRLSYSSNIFRMNDVLEGKVNESTQCGIEIIGTNNCKADSELVILAIKSILAIGIEEFEIELGQANFFKAVIDDTSLIENKKEKLRMLVERKNFNEIKNFAKENKGSMGDNCEVLMRLPELFGGVEVIDKARELTRNKAALSALLNIEDIFNTLKKVGLEKHVSIDLGMVQHINYYTGITFKGYCGNSGKEILSGGRYDKLIGNFGMNLNAIGFAIDVDNVLLSLKVQEKLKNETTNILIHYERNLINSAYMLAEKLWQMGYIAELSLSHNKESALNYAAHKGFQEVLILEDSGALESIKIENMIIRKIGLEDYINTLEAQNE